MLGAVPDGFRLCPVCQATAFRGSSGCCAACQKTGRHTTSGVPPARPDRGPAPPSRPDPAVPSGHPAGLARRRDHQPPEPPRPVVSGQATPADTTRVRRQAARTDHGTDVTSVPTAAPSGGTVTFVVPGVPRVKQRPRVIHQPDQDPPVRTFTPAATRDWEQSIADVARLHCRTPQDGTVAVELLFAGAHHSADVDNLAKAVLDGLQGVAFTDDRQVGRLVVERHPAGSQGPQVTVTVAPWTPPDGCHNRSYSANTAVR